MSKRTPYAPKTPYKFTLNLTDHVADTVHLSAEEHGAYLRLLFSYWRSGPPPDDDRRLAIIVGMSLSEWGKVRPLLEPFFEVLNGQWLHWRLDEELNAAYEAINKASAAGKAAAKARWRKEKGLPSSVEQCDGSAAAMRSQCESQFQLKVDDTPHATQAEPPQARAKRNGSYPQSFADVVSIAERDFGIGSAA